jgi:hypothetical protein
MSVFGTVTAPVRGVVGVVAAVPRVIEAVLVLPRMADQLDRVCENTDALPVMLERIQMIREDTRSLPHVEAELRAMGMTLGKIQQNTIAVEQMAETLLPLQGAALRVGRFADRVPQRRFGRNGRLAAERDTADHQ